MNIVLTGGGTGGHVIPSLALLPQLKTRFSGIYFMGGAGIEKQLAESAGLPFFQTAVIGFKRTADFKNLLIPFVLFKGVIQARKLLKRLNADVVFSKGGYAALPAVIAARTLKIPVIAHESDFTLGLANKVTQRLGGKILTAFPQSHGGFTHTGFPLRADIFSGDKQKFLKGKDFDLNLPVVLIMGGSGGSADINSAVLAALPALTKKYNIVHLTGKGKCRNTQAKNYCQMEFCTQMPDLYAAVDVVVSRAGAGAVSEIAALKKSALFIPLPSAASRGDQLQNAQYARKFGAVVLTQDKLTPDTLLTAIQTAAVQRMTPIYPDANQKIADILVEYAAAHADIKQKPASASLE